MQGGTGTGAGIRIASGNGTIRIAATGTVTALSGVAVLDGSGNVVISNYGTIIGDILTNTGDDHLFLESGSVTRGRIIMGQPATGNGSDRVTVHGTADISGVTIFEGGDDVYTADGFIDRLTFDGSTGQQVDSGILRNWEQVAVINGSNVTLTGSALLTGSGGDADGMPLGLFVGAGATLDIAGPALTVTGDVSSAGTISLQNGMIDTRLIVLKDTNAGAPAISGQYRGMAGRLAIDTMLEADDSPSDLLIIDGGAAVGAGGLAVRNVGGTGDLTTGDGIRVVQILNGGTTVPGAFYASGPIAAGPFEYLLYRGDRNGVGDDWFLRSRVIEPVLRPEVPAYLLATELAWRIGVDQLGTFHERRGDQSLLESEPDADYDPFWVRAYGQASGFEFDSILTAAGYNVHPRFDGRVAGFQAGADLWDCTQADGSMQYAGAFMGVSNGFGQTYGNVLLQDQVQAGRVSLNSYYLGGYFTHTTENGGYLDLVASVDILTGTGASKRGVSGKIDGLGITASVEAGQRISFNERWSIEPQAQAIWRNVSLAMGNDGYSDITYGNLSEFTGRIGARLEYADKKEKVDLIWHAGANLWHTPRHRNSTNFNEWALEGSISRTHVELNAGLAENLDSETSLFANVKYDIPLGRQNSAGLGAQLGLKSQF